MSFFSDVDSIVSKFKNDMAKVKDSAEATGFSRRVRCLPPSIWIAVRKDGTPGGGQELRARTANELIEAMQAFDKARPRGPK